ncbi:MAG: host-nuclease inhibitor Gam family protein [Candidatus Methylomirabilota bacterium]|jgi:hypothetical protein
MKIKSWEEADEALLQIALTARGLAIAKATVEEREGEIERTEKALEEFVREHAQDLKEKSRNLSHGRVWLRWATKLYTRSWKRVLEVLLDRKRLDLMHIKPKVNKEALEKCEDEFLEELGVGRKSGDVFGYETA